MGDTAGQMRHVPKLAWIPWALFAALELLGRQWALALMFACVGVMIAGVLRMRMNRSEIRVQDRAVEWRNWPTGWQKAEISDIAGVRCAKGVNRIHCELLVARASGRIAKRPVWARSGSQAAALAEQLGVPCANQI